MKHVTRRMLALAMAAAMAASAPVQAAEADPDMLAADWFAENFTAETWDEESEALYDATLGEFYAKYQEALEAETLAERFALMAVAEAKLLDSAVMIPSSTRGGNYAISRVAPYTANTTLWGNDNDRFHNVVVATEPIIDSGYIMV